MADFEALAQLMRQFGQKCIARMASRHHQMCRQRDFLRAHRPDMQVVHLDHAGLPAEQQFLWDNYAWFWNNNPTVNAMCVQLGLDPAVILAPDPYLT